MKLTHQKLSVLQCFCYYITTAGIWWQGDLQWHDASSKFHENITWVTHKYMMIHTDKSVAPPDHIMQAYRGNKGTAPLILNLSTRWR